MQLETSWNSYMEPSPQANQIQQVTQCITKGVLANTQGSKEGVIVNTQYIYIYIHEGIWIWSLLNRRKCSFQHFMVLLFFFFFFLSFKNCFYSFNSIPPTFCVWRHGGTYYFLCGRSYPLIYLSYCPFLCMDSIYTSTSSKVITHYWPCFFA